MVSLLVLGYLINCQLTLILYHYHNFYFFILYLIVLFSFNTDLLFACLAFVAFNLFCLKIIEYWNEIIKQQKSRAVFVENKNNFDGNPIILFYYSCYE